MNKQAATVIRDGKVTTVVRATGGWGYSCLGVPVMLFSADAPFD